MSGSGRFGFLPKIIALLSAEERLELWGLSFAVFLMAALEVAGIASITPFIAIVNDPSLIQKSASLSYLFHGFAFANSDHFILFVGVLALAVLVLSNSVS